MKKKQSAKQKSVKNKPIKSKSKYMFISGHFHVLGMRKKMKYTSCAAINKLEGVGRKASHCGSKHQ